VLPPTPQRLPASIWSSPSDSRNSLILRPRSFMGSWWGRPRLFVNCKKLLPLPPCISFNCHLSFHPMNTHRAERSWRPRGDSNPRSVPGFS